MPETRVPGLTSDEDLRWLTWVEKRFQEVAGKDDKIDINEFQNALNLKQVSLYL